MNHTRTLLDQLAQFAADVDPAHVPSRVAASVRHRVLDTIGLCLGAVPLATSAQALAVAKIPGGAPAATVIGFGDRLPVAGAAFVNGVLAHSLDFDDTHLPSVLHPSASIVPAGLAVAEEVSASGDDVIAALAVGYEVCIRTGMAAFDRALGNSVFFERGWHATSICGTLAAAAVAARLYRLDAAGIGHAIAIAASMGSGVIEANRSGGSVKRLHCGWAAHAGITAAQLAREGFTGPPTIFEGRFGFYQAFCGGSFDADEISRGLGDEWHVPDIFFKPYPANHFTHGGIDAALRLRKRLASVDEVASIELAVATPTLRTIAEPREQKIRPLSGYHAQFSGPFTFAAALLGGGGLGVWLDDFSDANARDERYLALASRVHCVGSSVCDAIFPNQFPAIATATLRDGRVLVEEVMANRGGPGNPLSEAELLTKFTANAGRVLTPLHTDRAIAALASFGDGPVSDTLAATRAPGTAPPQGR